jgi:hypothetical protein
VVTTLWDEASLDHEQLAREAALDRVTAELNAVMPFLLAARGPQEYAHRRALAESRLEAIALRHGISPDQVLEMADRHFALYREALTDGQDPVQEMVQSTRGYGTGPERPDSHTTGPDFSSSYSEVPQGAPGGPDPRVVTPDFPGPGDDLGSGEEGRESSSARAARKIAKRQRRIAALRAQADSSDYLSQTPPDLGTGMGSQDMGVAGEQQGPPSIAAGGGGGNNMPAGVPYSPPSIGQVTSGRDPVHQQIIAVAASVRASNPWLPQAECRRIARQTVGRYFTAGTDWTNNEVHDGPPVQTGGGGKGGGGGSMLDSMMEGQGLKSMIPGMGGGAGAAGGAAEVAELAAL